MICSKKFGLSAGPADGNASAKPAASAQSGSRGTQPTEAPAFIAPNTLACAYIGVLIRAEAIY